MKSFRHALSEVHSNKIGKGTKIWQFVLILENAIVGKNCNINAHVFIENDVSIGNNVTIKCGVQIWDGITLEDSVFIGPNATFTNDLVPRSKKYPVKFTRTLVKKGASIGANATILSGITIGEFAMVGAGSVLTKSVKKNELWFGNPARHVGYITNDCDILDMQLRSKKSLKNYKWENNELSEIND